MQYRQSIDAIERFAVAYDAYLANPDLGRRTEAETLVIRAAVACDRVGAVPGHAALDRWGVGNLAFLHEDPQVDVPVSQTAGPVRTALDHARSAYQQRIESEHRKRRNPVRWVGFGILFLITAPAKVAGGMLMPSQSGEIPVALVVIAAVASFVAVAGVTVTLLD